jgi:hypothetical protein
MRILSILAIYHEILSNFVVFPVQLVLAVVVMFCSALGVRNSSSAVGGLIPPGYCRTSSRVNMYHTYNSRRNMLGRFQLNSPSQICSIALNFLKAKGCSTQMACIRSIWAIQLIL